MGLEFDGVNGIIKNTTSDGDVTIKGNDGGSEISLLTFDVSAEGAATFNSSVAMTSFAVTDGCTITVTDNSDNLTLKSTDTDADVGPNLRLYRAVAGAASDAIGTIDWAAQDAGGGLTDYASAAVTITDATDGNEDGTLTFKVMNAGALNQMLTISGPETVVNEGSKDHDFRVESNGNANMLFVDGGSNLVGIGADPDLGAGLHIKSADSGASAGANADELVIEGNDNSGLTILSGTSGSGNIHFGDSGDNDIGLIRYDHGDNAFLFVTNTAEGFRVSPFGKISTNGETASPTGEGGLCLNQAANDDEILNLKSSDVAHGGTDATETDTYGEFTKVSGSSGGLAVLGYSDDSSAYGLFLGGRSSGVNTAVSTSAIGNVHIQAQSRSGSTGYAGLGSTKNICAIADSGTTRFTFNASGQFFADNDVGANAFDEYEDAQLVRAYDLSHGRGVIDSKFDDYIKYNHESLAEAGLVGREEDGTPNHFVNVTGFQRLHNGAIWQQYEKHQRLASAFYKLAEKTIGKEEADKLLTDEEIQLLN